MEASHVWGADGRYSSEESGLMVFVVHAPAFCEHTQFLDREEDFTIQELLSRAAFWGYEPKEQNPTRHLASIVQGRCTL